METFALIAAVICTLGLCALVCLALLAIVSAWCEQEIEQLDDEPTPQAKPAHDWHRLHRYHRHLEHRKARP